MLFLFQDPLGDAHGLAYLYPQAALYREAGEGYADLTALAGEVREGELVLKLRLARYPNPLGGPLGFSLATALVYLDLVPGGEEALLPGLRTPPGQGWEAAFVVTGFGVERKSPEGKREAVRAWREGEWVVWSPGLPPGEYGYYGAVGLYDPFAPWYLRPVSPEGGAWVLGAPLGMPPVVDVLALRPEDQRAAYQEGVLRPLRPKRFALEAPSLAAFGLGALSLVLAFLLGRKGR